MKLILATFILFSLNFAFMGSHALASTNDCPAGTQMLIQYQPGPSWNSVNSELTAHMTFINNQKLAKEVTISGILYDSTGKIVGALAVFNSVSWTHVEGILESDPFFSHEITTLSVQCLRQ